jgi:hypothetical protein
VLAAEVAVRRRGEMGGEHLSGNITGVAWLGRAAGVAGVYRHVAELNVNQLKSIPLPLARDLVLASIIMFPDVYKYDASSGTLMVDCTRLLDRWRSHVGTRIFDDSVSKLLALIDGFTVARTRYLGGGELQNVVRRLIDDLQKTPDPCRVIRDILEVSIETADGGTEVRWGRCPCIEGGATPAVFSANEAARVKVGIYVYVATVIGATLALLASRNVAGGKEFYFLVPNTAHEDLASRLPATMSFIRRLLEKHGVESSLPEVDEYILFLLLYSAVRARHGSLSFYVVRWSSGRGIGVSRELTVNFDVLRALGEALGYHDPENRLTELIVRVIADKGSGDKERAYVARLLEEGLARLAMVALGVGDPSEHINEIARIISDRRLADIVRGRLEEYSWILEKLPEIAVETRRLRVALI